MPFPTYHVGVNSFFGLALRRWVDPFVIVAVNVVIDLEVLFASGFPDSHQHWYFHTFLVGGIALSGFSVFLLLLVITWAAFACYKFEVHLSMPKENGQGIEHTQRSEGIVA